MTKEQAHIALEQLTGSRTPYRRLQAMVGANNFVLGEDYIQFRFKCCKKANHVRITLNEVEDTYSVLFHKIHRFNAKVVKEVCSVFWDDLKGIFETETGLALSL